MQATATEFKLNLGKYLELFLTEDIRITKSGKTVAKQINLDVSAVDAISGVLDGKEPTDLGRHDLREERLPNFSFGDLRARCGLSPLSCCPCRAHLKSSRRLTISWVADLSHHRAYRSVHGGSIA